MDRGDESGGGEGPAVMAKKQTRRSKAFADEHGEALAQLTERAIRDALEAPAAPIRQFRIWVPPRQVYPGGTCACCVGVIAPSTDKPRMVAWGRNGAMVRVCPGCYPPSEDVAQPAASRRYRPLDEQRSKLRVQILQTALRFDWFAPDDLAGALDVPSYDVDPQRRNNFDVMLSRLARQGYLERTGVRMSHRYRISARGRAEYEAQLQRRAA